MSSKPNLHLMLWINATLYKWACRAHVAEEKKEKERQKHRDLLYVFYGNPSGSSKKAVMVIVQAIKLEPLKRVRPISTPRSDHMISFGKTDQALDFFSPSICCDDTHVTSLLDKCRQLWIFTEQPSRPKLFIKRSVVFCST